MTVAFFDLDRTLIELNSAKSWIALEWREGNISVMDVAQASWWLFLYHLGRGADMNGPYESAVARLAGQPEADMDNRVREWFAAEVAQSLRPGAVAAMQAHRDAGDRLVLATSGSSFNAINACEHFNLDAWVATCFEVEDGLFTGRISEMAYGAAKADRVSEWAEREGVLLQDCAFYTDSFTDVALMELVGRPVAVNPDRKLLAHAQKRGWDVQDWGNATPHGETSAQG